MELSFNQHIKIGYLFDVTNSILDAIKILNICLENKTSVTSFSSLVHMCYKITESKKMELSTIHEILPSELVEKVFKLLNCKDICKAQLVCRRWKEIINKGKLVKRAKGKTSTNLLCLVSFASILDTRLQS